MKFVSWNVNGIKACWSKGLEEFILTSDADVVCLQETKLNDKFLPLAEKYRYDYWAFSERKGYSGTACLCRYKPLDVSYGIGDRRFDCEGRTITLAFPKFFLVNSYVPNSKGSVERFYFRLDWDEAFRSYLERLKREKPVIVCGDFNVARSYIDIYPENLLNDENPTGFLDEERDGMEQLLAIGFADAYRLLHPHEANAYTWWSNRLNKRLENRGWRIDYFLLDNALLPRLCGADILSDVLGSDHCPVQLEVRDE